MHLSIMHSITTFMYLLSLATSITSHAVDLPRRSDSPTLNIHLEQLDGAKIKVQITNQGQSGAVRLLTANSILERLHNKKLIVKKDGARLNFQGVDFHLNHNRFKHENFVSVAGGETVENVVDVAATHDLSAGGTFEVMANNRIKYANGDDTKIYGSIPYESNKITIQLAPGVVSAPTRPSKKIAARSRYARDSCTPDQLLNLTRAASIGGYWAGMGAVEALKPKSAVWYKYFRYNDTSNPEILLKFHKIVAQRLALISADLNAGFVSEVHCKNDFAIPEAEVNDACAAYPDNAIAFTYRSTCQIALCRKLWDLPIRNDDCTSRGAFDVASTLIHELSHCTRLGQVGLQPPTDDFTYDFEDTQDDGFMTAGMAVQNAHSHALFAKAVAVGGKKC